MTKTVKTREIMELLELDGKALTADDLVDREIAIEKAWQVRMQEMIAETEARYEARESHNKAHARVGQVAIGTLRAKNVVIPNLYPTSIGLHGAAATPIPEEEIAAAVQTVSEYAAMGRDFEVILQAVKDSDTLKSEWERFMMFLRLAQED